MKHAIRSLRKNITRCLVALLLLCFIVFGGGLTSCENRETGERMRFLLDSLQQANRNYEEFTSDSLQLELCRYFDRWGNSNERMKAYYLLGRAYHDMGEVPHALEIYQQAAEIADTTREDCDYRTLRAIYGQMGEVYDWQNLPEEELRAYREYSHYSWKMKDTLEALRGYELSIGYAILKNDTAKMYEITQHSHDLYLKYGYTKQAASVYGTAIFYLLENQFYEKAKMLMDIHEKESGLFDANGNIEQGREIYYYSQGLYQLGVNNLDSAECLFRKSALSNQPEAVYKGLLMVYEKRGNSDSIAKYAHLFAEANDEMHRNMRTETVEQITSMYNYERHQRIAEQAEANAVRLRLYFSIVCILASILITSIILYTNKRKRNLIEKLANENKHYFELKNELEEKEEILADIQDKSTTLTEGYKLKIAKLKSQLAQYQYPEPLNTNVKSELIDKLHYYARTINEKPTKGDWKELENYCMKTDADFMTYIGNTNENINNRDRRICMLIRNGFTSSEIAVLIGLSIPNYSARKRFINNKLFRSNTADKLEKHIINYKKC